MHWASVYECVCRSRKVQQKYRTDRTRGIDGLSSGALCVQERLAAAGRRVEATRGNMTRVYTRVALHPPPAGKKRSVFRRG